MEDMFCSVFSDNIIEFITLKRNTGHKYKNEESFFKRFDAFACSVQHSTPGLTVNLIKSWILHCKNNHRRTLYSNLSRLADFSRFLNRKGISSYIPVLPIRPGSSTIANPLSKKEFNKAIFELDKFMESAKQHSYAMFYSISVAVRTLYSTGIRVGELRNLSVANYNGNTGMLHVTDNKTGGKTHIPLHESMCKVLDEYIKFRNRKFPSSNKFLFPGINGGKLSHFVLRKWFKLAVTLAKVKPNSNIRIHDLRHTFAINSLHKMLTNGVPESDALLRLRFSLRHASLRSCVYYLQFYRKVIVGL